MGKWYQKNKTQLEGLTVGTFGVVSKSGSPGHCPCPLRPVRMGSIRVTHPKRRNNDKAKRREHLEKFNNEKKREMYI